MGKRGELLQKGVRAHRMGGLSGYDKDGKRERTQRTARIRKKERKREKKGMKREKVQQA